MGFLLILFNNIIGKIKIIIKKFHTIKTKNQISLLRRTQELEEIINNSIKELNIDILRGTVGNRPDNFGVYENWISNRMLHEFKLKNPHIEIKRWDFLIFVSGIFNDIIRKGFNKVKNRR